MIISSSNDYREAARRRLPPFLFHYIDGGAYAEYTLKRNVEDLSQIALRQRVLNDMSQLSLETKIFDETLSMPVALSPVGLPKYLEILPKSCGRPSKPTFHAQCGCAKACK